ncbi:ferrous iron transport protein A [Paenibacillus sp. PR3]|uniref:Ferrous iron transport protein A n=1 Tax=Paenibacillus terricola TaxID=2763503 RepID=A0ABR8N0G8_9BACL|nr:FeoA family protein [Paenibacillus terricola]MBD3921686.1 ferrous iron transport protein A [Paenibacillus terricola]
MTLLETSFGSNVKVMNLDNVHALVRRRLGDLGVMEGSVISLRKAMPFGGPCTIEIKGQWIAIRRKDAGSILVEAV